MPGGWFTASREVTLARLSGLVVAVLCLVRVTYLVARPELAITVVPDDAFYYLQLAHNRVRLGAWTFDGTAPTSGFHLLHAYLLAFTDLLLGAAGGDWLVMLAVAGSGAALALGLATSLLVRAGQKVYSAGAGWWAMVVMVSAPVIATSTMLLESHLVILGAAAVIYVVGAGGRHISGRAILMVVIGLVAALARSDFLLLPAMLWLACLATRQADNARFRRATAVFLGGTLGFGLTMLHTFLVSGTLLQTSVLTKLRWSAGTGLAVGHFTAGATAAILVLAGTFVALRLRRPGAPRLFREPIGLASLFTILGYGLVYALATRGFQLWYAASMIGPLAFAATMLGSAVRERWTRAVAAVLVVVSATSTLVQLDREYWPWQVGMLHAAERVRDQAGLDHLGAWNAGILSVVSGKTVTNLDGLVNDDAAAANAQSRLFDYLRERRITDIVDYADAVTEPETGQPEPRLLACLEQVAVLSDPGDDRQGSAPITHLRIVPGCG